MVWGLLLLAGVEEVIATIAMKYIDGTRKKWPIFVMTIGFILSFYCLSKAMQVLPAGVAYGVWTGIGSIGISLVGILWFKERFVSSQYISLVLILIGVIGLRMTS
ncbi:MULTISPECIES: multidrug efflux SMR transporter [Peribacillus]|uniref:DMT family transporter n=1 Tax=Peribacillus TaxID=2675229 RepID=UPI001DDC312F|nr:multidrug efflux SMR transporter [Peribacillus simplex]MED3987076.1 multidrug efflux SMR transporter [Peribacillus simplex]MED4094348.1 multidrug efflux SMR transporter [Peribacillus simplex]WHY99286.1 multidrug efflux SMR transporter [Peribacillus simplex]CAH0244783.1 Quaternary ammonium compound-resistance protein SugE [Peribacillus simplex]